MVDIPYGDAGYELTPKGKQFHIDGGYRLGKIRPLAKHAVTPITKPANKKQKPLTKFATWRSENPGTVVILGGLFAIALVVLGVWLTFNWNNITVSSFKSLFGISP